MRPYLPIVALFNFNVYSALLLIGVVQGLVYAALLAVRALREERWSDVFAAILLLVGVLYVSQWMLGFAGWYDSRDWRTTVMFYIEWDHLAALGPLLYLYFAAVTSTDFTWRRRLVGHFLPAILFAGVPLLFFAYDFGIHAGVLGQSFEDFSGTRGPAMEYKHEALGWLTHIEDLFVKVQLPVYLWMTWRAYRQYRAYVAREFVNAAEYELLGLRILLFIFSTGLALVYLSEVYAWLQTDEGYADIWWRYFAVSLIVFAAAVQFYALGPGQMRGLRFGGAEAILSGERTRLSPKLDAHEPGLHLTPAVESPFAGAALALLNSQKEIVGQPAPASGDALGPVQWAKDHRGSKSPVFPRHRLLDHEAGGPPRYP